MRTRLRTFWIATLMMIGLRIAQAGEAPKAVATYGTKDVILYRLGASDFVPDDSAGVHYSNDALPGSRRFVSGDPKDGTVGFFRATPHLPNGALVTYVRLDYCDGNSDTLFGGAVQIDVDAFVDDCDRFGNNCAQLSRLNSSDGPLFCASVEDGTLNYTVDNGERQFSIFVSVYATTSFANVVLGYKLQVSPAPATATFGDVPTDYIYFRAIEALASSGITSGCGGGNFCPNQAVTRGELAKFLANALGLHHPN